MPITLSKTDFLEYLKCSKCLWLKKHKPDMYLSPEITDFDMKNFDEGREVEVLARKLFPKGILLEGAVDDLFIKTKELIKNKEAQIFQATFMVDKKLIAKIDVLEYDPKEEKWNIYEIKSSTKVNTDRDHNHLKDVAFQKIVTENFGLTVGKTYIIHLNKEYKKSGEIDINKLFVKVDVTNDVREIYENTVNEIEKAIAFLEKDEINIELCGCLYLTRNNHCSSFNVLNPKVPDYSVHDISRIHPTKLKNLIDSGILDIMKVPDNFELTEIQRNQVSLAQSQKIKINKSKIKEIINELKKPLYFIDYETYLSAIPLLDGFGPHQHIPFQVSIHVLEADDSLKHFEYLAQNINEAIPGVIELLLKIVNEKGSIISWHSSFEGARNKEIGEIFPKYNDFLSSINQRTFDLELLFKSDYIHPEFKGKTSIKKVLPALLPQFSYKELDVQGGTEAMETWRKIIFDDVSEEEKKKLRESLLSYCKMDTLAMVEIYNHLIREIQ